jgi:hypothetical protein
MNLLGYVAGKSWVVEMSRQERKGLMYFGCGVVGLHLTLQSQNHRL